MNAIPAHPAIYHITHVDNLPAILIAGGLWSDAVMQAHGGPQANIGMTTIKRRRLALPVKCHPGTRVGEYVPSYFCPRSIMLYLIHRANHEELMYRGGQEPILHLEADLYEVVDWAQQHGQRWAFSLSNAGANYAEFRNRLDVLSEIDWAAVGATDFRDPMIKEGKQAEFLLYEFFPWHLVRRIGIINTPQRERVLDALAGAVHQPVVEIRREWYY